jgi:hypothetical protein
MVANVMKEVAEAVKREDFEVALVEAVSAWRTYRHAVLAELVDAIAARCKPVPLTGRGKDAYQKAWLELAKRAATSDDPAAIGALVRGLTKSVPERAYSYFTPQRDVKRYRPFLERIDALAKCADDPRVASALADLLVKAPISADDVGGVYGPAIELVIHLGDERSIGRLHHLVANPVAKTQRSATTSRVR